MTVERKTVAIVGAGPGGLGAAKACLEENLLPSVFEKRDKLGGLWNYEADTSIGTLGRIHKNLVLNTCNIMCGFSDFPLPDDTPPFPTHEAFLKYFNDYADHFKLKEYIHLSTEVVNIDRADDYDVTGRWTVATRQHNQQVVTTTYDFVMVCSGAFSEPFIATFPGIDQFKGDILHSAQFRDSKPFVDKKVLVIGESFSAVDVVTEISNATTQAYLSARHGFWIYGRQGPDGWPLDTFLLRRYFPLKLKRFLYKRFLERDTDYSAIALKPHRDLFNTSFAVSDFLVPQIICGKVKVFPEVKQFLSNGVEFTDGTTVNDLDIVVIGTGYRVKTPFIDDRFLSDDVETRDLYQYTFPIRLRHPTLAAIGLFATETAPIPIMEMQSRWAVRVFKTKCGLPPVEQMKNHITSKADELRDRYGKYKLFVPISLLDELADLTGCYPSIWRIFLRDPRLAVRVFFAPMTPFAYRLVGPHSWPGARDAVMTCWDRCLSGLRKSSPIHQSKGSLPWLFPLGLVTIIIASIADRYPMKNLHVY